MHFHSSDSNYTQCMRIDDIYTALPLFLKLNDCEFTFDINGYNHYNAEG